MATYKKIIIALVVCAMGLGFVLWIRKSPEVDEIPGQGPVPIEAQKAKSGAILRKVSTVGNLSAVQLVTLHPEVSGKVTKIYFQEGARVEKGEPLFKIDDSLYKAKLNEAQALYALRKEDHGRAVKLLERKFGTVQQRDKTYAEMKIAEAQVEEARIRVENTVIKAPFEGVMGLSSVSVGTLVSESTELANLVDLDPINVDFNVPESYLPNIEVGDIVDVTIEDFDILPVEATITAISPEIEEATRTITIRAQMPNEEIVYRPGEFARVLVLAGQIDNAVLIPETAIEREGDEEFVMLVVDNVAVRSTVSTGMRDGNEVEVTHGVKAGDLVITAGQFKVRDGDEVAVVNQAAAPTKG